MKWLQTINAGPQTGPILACAVIAWIFGTPGIILLAVWCLIARAEANQYLEQLKKWNLIETARNAIDQVSKRPWERPEDEVRRQVLDTWKEEK